MNRPDAARVMLVTRSFWPLAAGQHENAAAAIELARRWTAAGASVQVATTRHHGSWNDHFFLGDIEVHRVATMPRGEWAMQRYIRLLSSWLQKRSEALDAVVCHQMREEAIAVAALKSDSGQSAPHRILISSGCAADSDAAWAQSSRWGKQVLRAAQGVEAVVTSDPTAHRFWVSRGVESSRVIRIARGFERQPRPSLPQRIAARKSLASINSDLTTQSGDVVLVWCGFMHGKSIDASGIGMMVNNARLLLARFEKLKIWLIGDGPLRDWAHAELRAEGVRAMVSLPGSFAELDEVFAAADVAVTTGDEQMRYFIPAALQAGLPMVAPNHLSLPDGLGLVMDESLRSCIAWYDAERPRTMRSAIATLVENLPAANDNAAKLSQSLCRHLDASGQMKAWMSQFSRPKNVFEKRV